MMLILFELELMFFAFWPNRVNIGNVRCWAAIFYIIAF